MNLSRLGWIFVVVFALIALMELRWFLEIYGFLTLVPIAIVAVIVLVGIALLRGYVEKPIALADTDDGDGESLE